ETIQLTASARAAGFTGSGTHTIQGPARALKRLTIDGKGQNDQVTVLWAGLRVATTIQNTGGQTDLHVDDSGAAAGAALTLGAGALTGVPGQAAIRFATGGLQAL